jgi:hypothetical protein
LGRFWSIFDLGRFGLIWADLGQFGQKSDLNIPYFLSILQ